MSTCSMGALIVAEKLDSTKVLSSMMTSPLVLLTQIAEPGRVFAAQRNDLNAARSSAAKIAGCSHAAK